MKYIRTKDGIFEVNWFDADEFGDENGEPHSNCEIEQEADTIEELCDEFVWISPKNEHAINHSPIGVQRIHKRTNPELEIYGAIWTDKGLIYVAKMNDKGELELL